MNARMFNGNNLPHELLLTTRLTTKLRNAIENNLQTDIKLSKAPISKIIESGGFLILTASSSAMDAGVQKKIYGSGKTT